MHIMPTHSLPKISIFSVAKRSGLQQLSQLQSLMVSLYQYLFVLWVRAVGGGERWLVMLGVVD